VSKARLPFFSAEICKAAREISWRLGYRVPKTARRGREAKKTTRGKAANRG